MALDSAGNPGLAYLLNTSDSYNTKIMFWRPSSTAAVSPFDTEGQGNDDPDVKLTFFGTEPRIAFAGAADSNYFSDYNHMLWVSRSQDGGQTWTPKQNVPSDQGASLDPPMWIAAGSQGQSAIAIERTGGTGTDEWGEPKLVQSTDFVNWKTTAPAPVRQPDFSAHAPVVLYGQGDQLLIAFQQPTIGADLPYGVILWKQPLGGPNAPAIYKGGVVIHAGVSANVSPGSLADIYGTNIGPVNGVSADWNNPPLGTNLGNTQVMVNGVAAPMIYASSGQDIFQVPDETQVGPAQIVVVYNGESSPPGTVNVQQAAPSILLFNGNRAILQNDSDGSVNDEGNPASPSAYWRLYLIGSGPVDNPVATGALVPASPLSRNTLPVTVTVGSTTLTPFFAGYTPGFLGLMQIDFQIPNLPAGDYQVTVKIGDSTSNSGTITIGQ